MRGKIKKLKDNAGQYLYPITVSEAIFVDDSKNLKTKLTEIDNAISASSGGGSTNGGYIPDINEYSLIGDSLTADGAYAQIIKTAFSIPTVNNYAISGKTLAGATGMVEQASKVPSSSNLVTIMGGTNDANTTLNLGAIGNKDTATYLGAYQTIIETLLAKNPLMRIILITPPRSWWSADPTKPKVQLDPFVTGTKDIAKHYGLPCFDLHNLLGMNSYNFTAYLTDGIHFTTEGKTAVGRLIKEFIRVNY